MAIKQISNSVLLIELTGIKQKLNKIGPKIYKTDLTGQNTKSWVKHANHNWKSDYTKITHSSHKNYENNSKPISVSAAKNSAFSGIKYE